MLKRSLLAVFSVVLTGEMADVTKMRLTQSRMTCRLGQCEDCRKLASKLSMLMRMGMG